MELPAGARGFAHTTARVSRQRQSPAAVAADQFGLQARRATSITFPRCLTHSADRCADRLVNMCNALHDRWYRLGLSMQ